MMGKELNVNTQEGGGDMCSHFPLWCKCCMLQEEGAEGEKVMYISRKVNKGRRGQLAFGKQVSHFHETKLWT